MKTDDLFQQEFPLKWHADSFNEYWDLEWMAGWQISWCYTQICSRNGSAFKGTIQEGSQRSPEFLHWSSLLSAHHWFSVPLCVSCSVSRVFNFLRHPTDLCYFLPPLLHIFFFLFYCFISLPFTLLSLSITRHDHTSGILLLFTTNQPTAIIWE